MGRNLLAALVALAAGAAVAVLAAETPAPAPPPVTPADVIVAAAGDLTAAREVGGKVLVPALDPGTARTIRYIWNDTGADPRLIDGHLNLLNRRAVKTAVRVTPWLLRIDTAAYGEQFQKSWEKLGTGVDWVFHDEEFTEELETYEEVEEWGYWQKPDGSRRGGGPRRSPDEVWVTTSTKKVQKQRVKQTRGLAAWVADDPRAKAALEVLQAKTGGTDVPVLAWSQFFWETALQDQRKVGYYGMLGVKNQKDYEAIIGVVRKGIDPEKLAERRDAIALSTVTTEQTLRRIIYEEAVGGGHWLTQDSNQERRGRKDRDRGNPLFNHGDDYVFDAQEAFGNLPNGMPATALFDADGVVQAVAPPFIASDATAPFADRQVHVNLSCVRCHADGGMKDVRGWVRNVLNLPPNQLNGRTPEEKYKLADLYVHRRLEPALRSFRERVDLGCLEATGWKFSQFSAAYAREWVEVSGPVTLEKAARRLGTTPAAYRAALVRLGPSIHPNLAAHRLDKPEAVPAVLWAQAYPFAQYALKGKIKPFKVEVKDK